MRHIAHAYSSNRECSVQGYYCLPALCKSFPGVLCLNTNIPDKRFTEEDDR